jgi:hypothetical protein
MVVTNQNDSMYAGNNHTTKFTIKDQDTPGSPAKNLSGLSVRYALCRIGSSGDVLKTPIFEHTTANPAQVLVTDAMNGIVEVYFVHADTVDLAAGDYYHEVELYDATPFSLVVATGTMTINTNVGAT